MCLHQGINGYQAYMEAFHYFKMAASGGHPRAHYMVGCYYAMGIAGLTSEDEAAKHFKIAADEGVSDAAYNYAVCLLEGKGTEKS